MRDRAQFKATARGTQVALALMHLLPGKGFIRSTAAEGGRSTARCA